MQIVLQTFLAIKMHAQWTLPTTHDAKCTLTKASFSDTINWGWLWSLGDFGQFLNARNIVFVLFVCFISSLACDTQSVDNTIKGTKWAVFGGKRINSTLYWKGSIVSNGIRTPDPWVAKRAIYHWVTWLAHEWHKNSVYQVQNKLFNFYKSFRYTQLS